MAPVALAMRPTRSWATHGPAPPGNWRHALVVDGVVVAMLAAWVGVVVVYGSMGPAPGAHPAFHAGHALGGVVGVVVAAALLASE